MFTGQMDYFPNEDAVLSFVQSPLPALLDRYPDLGFDVVGRAPGARLRKVGADPAIHVTGEVSDIRPFLESAWVFVAPLRIARGVQNKVLEAAACELPIVCSPGVFRGLEDGGFRDGEHLLVARDDADYVEQISRLIEEPDLRTLLGRRARRLLSTNYSWDDNMRYLESGIERQSRSRSEAVTMARG